MLEEGEANELYEVFIRRLAGQIYPIPDRDGSEFEADRFDHIDLIGWTKEEVLADLEALRIRRRLLPHPWLNDREIALQNSLPSPRRRAIKREPRARRRRT